MSAKRIIEHGVMGASYTVRDVETGTVMARGLNKDAALGFVAMYDALEKAAEYIEKDLKLRMLHPDYSPLAEIRLAMATAGGAL